MTTTSTNTTSVSGARKDDAITVSSGTDGVLTVSSGRNRAMATESGTDEVKNPTEDAITVASGNSGAVTPESVKDEDVAGDEDEVMNSKNADEKVEEGFGSLQITGTM